MKKIGIISFFLSINFIAFSQSLDKKKMLVIFAHPDDEMAIGPLFVKYKGVFDMNLIVALDGRNGSQAGHPPGDQLAKLREGETECGCNLLGINDPIFSKFHDSFNTSLGVREYLNQSRSMKDKLTNKINEINPDFIITFGPDGDTGHSDHRMISNMVTEIVLKNGWVEKFPLYYLAWTDADNEKFQMIGGLNTVDPKYFNTTISYSDEEEFIALKALDCYKSQFTKQDVEEWRNVETNDSRNTFYFRKLSISSEKSNTF